MSSDAAEPVEPQAPEVAPDAPADPDDVKAKFLAALQHKHGGRGGVSGPGAEGSKIHGTHSAAGGKRNFRRKSGG
ncbi:DUF5302 domain-containing protein [Saccharothrix sp. ST-888]|uniref:DUF5302 domain-containing protein n=1 Tax=Saccharothrix sp. ST-888 TaxID=1427391 RepID=UPI0005ECCF9D|nr:DUF5302 domain-containing protein [Saccharothrix sp. ST-888]KJK57615.1 hypothetical protein UK12_15405 [Saccharothrix sp. ST-888]